MAVDTLTVPAPVTLPDAKPSDLIESLPEDRWTKYLMRTRGSHGQFRYCSLGILLEHAGYDWNNPAESCRLVEETYGIPGELLGTITEINDTEGKTAVVTYLRERGL